MQPNTSNQIQRDKPQQQTNIIKRNERAHTTRTHMIPLEHYP